MSEDVKSVETTARIQECYTCGCLHEEVEIKPLKGSGQAPYTHWYECPTLIEPCLMGIAGDDKTGGKEMPPDLIEKVRVAMESGRWVFCIGYLTDGDEPGKVKCNYIRQTNRWDVGVYADWLTLQQKDIEQDVVSRARLPELKHKEVEPAPAIKMFGDDD